jgi:acetyl esterase/lipase
MRLLTLLLIVLLLPGCGRTSAWAVNVGVDDDRIEVRTYDAGRGLALDVHRPAGAGVAAPVIVYLHGGRWRDGDRTEARFVGQRLADAGALVLVPDFRQAPDHRFPAFVEDAARAVAWARAHAGEFGGDPRRVFVMGHSSGAHIAALLGTDARWLRAVGMAPRDLAGIVGWSGAYDFLPIREIDLVEVFGTGEQWPASQPVNHVDGDEPPFLLVHGLDDDVVRPANSASLQAKLQAAGIAAEYVPLEDTGHAGVLLELKLPGTGPALAATREFVGL